MSFDGEDDDGFVLVHDDDDDDDDSSSFDEIENSASSNDVEELNDESRGCTLIDPSFSLISTEEPGEVMSPDGNDGKEVVSSKLDAIENETSEVEESEVDIISMTDLVKEQEPKEEEDIIIIETENTTVNKEAEVKKPVKEDSSAYLTMFLLIFTSLLVGLTLYSLVTEIIMVPSTKSSSNAKQSSDVCTPAPITPSPTVSSSHNTTHIIENLKENSTATFLSILKLTENPKQIDRYLEFILTNEGDEGNEQALKYNASYTDHSKLVTFLLDRANSFKFSTASENVNYWYGLADRVASLVPCALASSDYYTKFNATANPQEENETTAALDSMVKFSTSFDDFRKYNNSIDHNAEHAKPQTVKKSKPPSAISTKLASLMIDTTARSAAELSIYGQSRLLETHHSETDDASSTNKNNANDFIKWVLFEAKFEDTIAARYFRDQEQEHWQTLLDRVATLLPGALEESNSAKKHKNIVPTPVPSILVPVVRAEKVKPVSDPDCIPSISAYYYSSEGSPVPPLAPKDRAKKKVKTAKGGMHNHKFTASTKISGAKNHDVHSNHIYQEYSSSPSLRHSDPSPSDVPLSNATKKRKRNQEAPTTSLGMSGTKQLIGNKKRRQQIQHNEERNHKFEEKEPTRQSVVEKRHRAQSKDLIPTKNSADTSKSMSIIISTKPHRQKEQNSLPNRSKSRKTTQARKQQISKGVVIRQSLPPAIFSPIDMDQYNYNDHGDDAKYSPINEHSNLLPSDESLKKTLLLLPSKPHRMNQNQTGLVPLLCESKEIVPIYKASANVSIADTSNINLRSKGIVLLDTTTSVATTHRYSKTAYPKHQPNDKTPQTTRRRTAVPIVEIPSSTTAVGTTVTTRRPAFAGMPGGTGSIPTYDEQQQQPQPSLAFVNRRSPVIAKPSSSTVSSAAAVSSSDTQIKVIIPSFEQVPIPSSRRISSGH